MGSAVSFWVSTFTQIWNFRVLPNVTVSSLVLCSFAPLVILALFRGVNK